MSATLTARERHIAHQYNSLAREARETLPRSFVSDELHNHESKEICRERSHDLLVALARLHQHYIDGDEVAAMVNYAAPDDCQVVSASAYDELKTQAIAAWKLLAEIIDIATKNEVADPHGRILDLIRDTRRFDRDFRDAELNLPDVVANN